MARDIYKILSNVIVQKILRSLRNFGRETIEIEVHHRGECQCASFLAPITSWKEVAERHNSQHAFTETLIQISDWKEDWTVDLFRCEDCRRYWGREDVGQPFLTRSYSFFYLADIKPNKRPDGWLREQRCNSILDKLEKNKDADYYNLIEPHLSVK